MHNQRIIYILSPCAKQKYKKKKNKEKEIKSIIHDTFKISELKIYVFPGVASLFPQEQESLYGQQTSERKKQSDKYRGKDNLFKITNIH